MRDGERGACSQENLESVGGAAGYNTPETSQDEVVIIDGGKDATKSP